MAMIVNQIRYSLAAMLLTQIIFTTCILLNVIVLNMRLGTVNVNKEIN